MLYFYQRYVNFFPKNTLKTCLLALHTHVFLNPIFSTDVFAADAVDGTAKKIITPKNITKIQDQQSGTVVGLSTHLTNNVSEKAGNLNPNINPNLNPIVNVNQLSNQLDVALLQVYAYIQKNQPSDAQAVLSQILVQQPNFKLAQGLKLALDSKQPTSKLEKDLRHEAEVRIASIIKPVDKLSLPASFLQLASWQKTAMLVDAYSARIYIYENARQRPRYLFDLYITIGKNGMIKQKEGDGRTPIGIYHLEKFMPSAVLPDLYGFGAMPMNFPNTWDKLHNTTGSNIWLHGVPYDTYSRAPLASRGCVVLSNKDVRKLFQFAQVDHTPIAINTKHQWLPEQIWQKQRLLARYLFTQWLLRFNQQKTKNAQLNIDLKDVAIYSYPNLVDIQKQHTQTAFLELNGDNLDTLLKANAAANAAFLPRSTGYFTVPKNNQNNQNANTFEITVDESSHMPKLANPPPTSAGLSHVLMFEFYLNNKRIQQFWQQDNQQWVLVYSNL